MTDVQSPRYLAIGGIFIDDIVYPDGRTSMEILGGGGVHAAAGMLPWDEHPGLVATMGSGMPTSAFDRLQRDFDLQGVIEVSAPQIRAWQIFEWSGKRTEIYRLEDLTPYENTPVAAQNPPAYRAATGAAILRTAEEFIHWKNALPGVVALWEPEQAYMVAENSAEFRQTLPATDIVSPNLLEASLVYGFSDPHRLLDAMLEDGATIATLRMGAEGSLVASATERIAIPAVPISKIVDQTGAGNSYTGGFLVGWCRTRDLKTAGCYGAVSGSFAVEIIGILDPPEPAIRDARLNWALEHSTAVR